MGTNKMVILNKKLQTMNVFKLLYDIKVCI